MISVSKGSISSSILKNMLMVHFSVLGGHHSFPSRTANVKELPPVPPLPHRMTSHLRPPFITYQRRRLTLTALIRQRAAWVEGTA